MTQVLSSVQDLYETWCTARRTVAIELMLSLFNPEAGDRADQSEGNGGPRVIGGSAFGYTKLQTALLSKLLPEPFEGELRATHGLIKRGESWRIVRYHESRQLDLAQEMGFALDA